MFDPTDPFNHNDLSPEDLEVLRTFQETNDFMVTPGEEDDAPRETSSIDPELQEEEEMLLIFASEAAEDISSLRQGLAQIERDERGDSPGFFVMQRVAHKIRGTAAAIGCFAMSSLAHHIETIISKMKSGAIPLYTGLFALGHAVGALETTLDSVVAEKQESMAPLLRLEGDCEALQIPLQPDERANEQASLEESEGGQAAVGRTMPDNVSRTWLPADRQRLQRLVQHAEQLVEQQTTLDQARRQVQAALEELQAAQARLQRLEAFFSIIPFASPEGGLQNARLLPEELPASSLVARILQEAAQRTGHMYQFKQRPLSQPLPLTEAAQWDEMEIDRFTESNLLMHALSEAIADVTTATAQLQVALAHLDTLVNQQTVKAAQVRAESLKLGTAPFSTFAHQVRDILQKVAQEQGCSIQVDISGEAIAIDQEILDALLDPLMQLVCANAAEELLIHKERHESCLVSLDAHTIGNEVVMQFGFSISMPGGALHLLQEVIEPLHGSITVQHTPSGGMRFRLRFPHARGIVQGLLVRAGKQRAIIPFSQVERIDYQLQEARSNFYTLAALLGVAAGPASEDAGQAVLRLCSDHPHIPHFFVQVDEALGLTELLVKPLAAPLRRPGVIGSAIDSSGNALLVLDIPELIQQYKLRQQLELPNASLEETARQAALKATENKPVKILIADDSFSIRQSLRQTLSQKEEYEILEARDGNEALELLAREAPNLLLLDLEMPGMNGYDVLTVLRTRSLLPNLKIILLTSRTSEKHRKRAHDLGVHTYLTKPCPDPKLLSAVQSLLITRTR